MIGTLFKDYRPLKFFTLIALIFAIIGLALGIPIVVEYFQTGLVPRFPTAILAASFMFLCGLSLATGLILDSVAKSKENNGSYKPIKPIQNKKGSGLNPDPFLFRPKYCSQNSREVMYGMASFHAP